jgi:predicted type IV restriction endonuclease
MAIETTLVEITARLRQGRFPNEQSVSQGIVLRVLAELGWDTFDPSRVWPEFQTGEGRADFALCHPPGKPAIFIEVKQPGRAEDAVRQALEYAFHVGVPFVVLTDGKTWSFYLPAEQGSYEDRRVYKLDLFERAGPDAVAVLERYLSFAGVQSGDALKIARAEYGNRNRRERARAAIAEAWQELVEKGDEQLVELVASVAETKAGIRPDDDDVAEFLARLGKLEPRSVPARPQPRTQPVIPACGPAVEPVRRGTLILRGRQIAYSNAKDAMLIVLRELATEDSTFLERCSQHPDMQGRKRRYIAKTPEELYPDRPDLRAFREELPGGWWVGTNANNVLKQNVIRVAADVAGLKYGEDIVVPI